MDTKTKHTGPPWDKSKDGVPPGHIQITVYSQSGHRIATVFNNEADADLIVAAPNLLEAMQLRNALEENEVHPDDTRWKHVRKLEREAIALATGKC